MKAENRGNKGFLQRDIAIGIDLDGRKDVLGMWVGEMKAPNIG